MSDQNNNPFDPNSNFTPPPDPGAAPQETPGQAQPQQWQAPPQQPQYQQAQPQYQPQPGQNQFQPAPGVGGFGDPAEMERQRLTGIGGLLLLYVILSIIGVLLKLFGLPDLIMYGGALEWLLFAAVVGLSVAGLVLIFMRKKIAILTNIAACAVSILSSLWSAIAVGSALAAYGAMSSYGYSDGYDDAMAMATLFGVIAGLLASLIVNTLWIIYFVKSKRVKYTLTQ